jgi:thiol-disulfide isomerase/thioredoxin
MLRPMTTPWRRTTLLLTLFVGVPIGCRADASNDATTVPDSATTTVISLQGIDCESCGTRVITALARPGIYATAFDRNTAELTVQYDATQVSVADMLAAVTTLGYTGSEGAGQGAYIPEVEFGPDLDVVKIASGGETVELESHLAPGKVTVFDFYAVWCKPCRAVDRHMRDVLTQHDDVALRKLDVVDWDSEVAKQHLKSAAELPYVFVYGRDGKQVAAISGLALEVLDAAIAKGRGR